MKTVLKILGGVFAGVVAISLVLSIVTGYITYPFSLSEKSFDKEYKIMDNVSDLGKDEADTIIDAVEMIKEEILKKEPKGKIISNGIKLLAPMLSIANGIPALAENIQQFIDFVTPYIS